MYSMMKHVDMHKKYMAPVFPLSGLHKIFN